MMGSNRQNFLRGRKLENHFFPSWISAKRYERFFIFFKNQKRTIFYPNLPPDTYGYKKKFIYHDDGHGKTKTMYISDFWPCFAKIHDWKKWFSIFWPRKKFWWVRARHFPPPTFCRGLPKSVLLLWSLSIIIWLVLIIRKTLKSIYDQKRS